MVTSSSGIRLLPVFLPLRLLPLKRRRDALRNEPTLEIELRAKEPRPVLLNEPRRDPELSCCVRGSHVRTIMLFVGWTA